jgi:hypothetical protein
MLRVEALSVMGNFCGECGGIGIGRSGYVDAVKLARACDNAGAFESSGKLGRGQFGMDQPYGLCQEREEQGSG